MVADVEKIADKVSNLQQDMAQVGTIVERLDLTIEKITEVSTTVSQILAVQGNRLENQEKTAEKLQKMMDKTKSDSDNNIREIYNRIERVEKGLHQDMDNNNSKVLEELKKLRDEGNKQHESLNERMKTFEKWMYIIMGGGIVIMWFINQVDITKIF